MVARVAAQPLVGLVGVEAELFDQHALGLLDDDAGVQGVLQLSGQLLGVVDGAGHGHVAGGHVGQGGGGVEDLGGPRAGVVPVQVQRPDRLGPHRHGHAEHGAVAELDGLLAVGGPAVVGGDVVDADQLPRAVRRQARTVLVGDLGLLEPCGAPIGGRQEVQHAGPVVQADAGTVDGEDRGALVGQVEQHLADVVVTHGEGARVVRQDLAQRVVVHLPAHGHPFRHATRPGPRG